MSDDGSAAGDGAFDASWWERHYRADRSPTDAERQHGHGQVHQAPSPSLVAVVADLPPGTALDAGCGTGADARWLAEQGWQVTAVDVSPSAVTEAERLDTGERVSWLVADLTVWVAPRSYDLVLSQYVHPEAEFGAFVQRLATAVAPGGTLLVVGHDHADSHSASHAPRDASISADEVTAWLSADQWDVVAAETRTRQQVSGPTELTLTDLVVHARRRPSQ